MPKKLKILVAASALIGGLLAAPALYAHGTGGGGMMGGMMQGRQGHVMDHDGSMEGMMNMMSQMSGMMEHCNEMMQGTGDHESGAQRPNEQWGGGDSAPPRPSVAAGTRSLTRTSQVPACGAMDDRVQPVGGAHQRS